MHDPLESAHEDTAPPQAPFSSGIVTEIAAFGRAFKQVFGAQFQLLAAELGVARAAVSWMLIAGLAATIAGVGLGLSLLALLGLLLAKWFGSWLWACLVLCLLQLLFLIGSVLLFRQCMHWMSLPVTREEWGTMMRETLREAKDDIGSTNNESSKEG